MYIASRKVRALIRPAALLVLLAASPAALAQTTDPIVGGGNTAPVITSLQQEQVPGQKFRIFGTVADETPQNCGVVISGAASGVMLCDAQGNFEGTFDVATPGQIEAVAGDGELQSDPSVLNLTNYAPTVDGFIAVQGPNDSWTFSGSVGDEAPSGLTVTLSGPPGVQGATATVQADGSWSVTLTLAPGTSGNVTATVADWYGLTGEAYTTFGS